MFIVLDFEINYDCGFQTQENRKFKSYFLYIYLFHLVIWISDDSHYCWKAALPEVRILESSEIPFSKEEWISFQHFFLESRMQHSQPTPLNPIEGLYSKIKFMVEDLRDLCALLGGWMYYFTTIYLKIFRKINFYSLVPCFVNQICRKKSYCSFPKEYTFFQWNFSDKLYIINLKSIRAK